jgi:N-acetylglutamate synthase-like GNAT family acetyltransferase
MIRPATDADIDAILDLQERASRDLNAEVFGDAYEASAQTVRERWRAAYVAGESTFLVYDDGGIVGVTIFAPPWFHALHVTPERWGSGVADSLYEHALDDMRQAGETEAFARIWALNTRSIRFFERRGWTRLDWTDRAKDPPHPEVVLYMKALK